MELINTIMIINVDNYLDHYSCHIIDKLMKVKSKQQYLATKKEIDKTRVSVEINLHGKKMQIKQFHRV
jgi:hypothetical protein